MRDGELSALNRVLLRARYASKSLARCLVGQRRLPIIFIHVPKTAGNSAMEYIQACVGMRRPHGRAIVHDNETKLGREEDIRRARQAAFVGGHMSWQTFEEIRNGRRVFSFTFLRDPLDRLLSNFSFLKTFKDPAHAEKHFPGISAMSLAEYAACTHPRYRYGLDNFMTRQFAGSLDDYPDNAVLASQMLARAKAHLCKLDFVGFTDRFDNDFDEVVKQAGLPQLGITPRYNVTGRADCKKDSPTLDAGIRRQLLNRVHIDMELWRFARERFLRE